MQLVRIIVKDTKEVVFALFKGEIVMEGNGILGNLIGTSKKESIPPAFEGSLIHIQNEDLDEFILNDDSLETPKIWNVIIEDNKILLEDQMF